LDKIDLDAAIITMQAMNATVHKVGFALAFLPRQWFCCERSIDVWMPPPMCCAVFCHGGPVL